MSNLPPPDKWPGRTTGPVVSTTLRPVEIDGENARTPFDERLL